MSIASILLGPVASLADKALDRFVPDPAERAKAALELQKLMADQMTTELKAARDIIVAEANSGSWLAQNWRPIIMLWFAGLVGAHWMGFTPENLPTEQVLKLLDIVYFGIGGYVVGRSAEKTIPKIAEALRK